MCSSYTILESSGNPPLIGTCSQFCPRKEAESRKVQRRLHLLEVSTTLKAGGDETPVPVKEFIRSGAGHVTPEPSDLRPLSILVDAITYLIARVCTRIDHPWWLIAEFVSNRLQSIRQDITYQQLTGSDVDYIFQLATRFHLYTQSRLWRCPMSQFDPKLNSDNLQQCLLKLVRQGVMSYPEFEAYHLLGNLGNTDSLQHALELSKDIRGHPCILRALRLSRSYLECNYVHWFRLVSRLSPLEQAAVLPYASAMRRTALGIVSKAYCYRGSTVPLKTLSNWLLVPETTQMQGLCSAYGLEVCGEAVLIKKGCFTLPAEAIEGDDLDSVLKELPVSDLVLPSLNV